MSITALAISDAELVMRTLPRNVSLHEVLHAVLSGPCTACCMDDQTDRERILFTMYYSIRIWLRHQTLGGLVALVNNQ